MEELHFIATYDVIFIGVLTFCLFMTILQYTPYKASIVKLYPIVSICIIVGSALYLGSRSNQIGVDTQNYKNSFNILSNVSLLEWGRLTDILFYAIMHIFAQFATWPLFLTFCGLIYLGGAYWGMRGLFGKMALFSLLIFIISPNFFQFSINVMRNGFAASVFIMSFYWHREPKKMYTIMALASMCHISMLLPLGIFIAVRKVISIRIPLIILAISVIMQTCHISIGRIFTYFISDNLAAIYFDNQMDGEVQTWGSLVAYGLSPVFTSIYFIGVKKFHDPFYIRLLSMFCVGMAIYVQIMNLPLALRFAYLSTFLMPVLLIYPMLKRRYWQFQNMWITMILLIIFIFKTSDIISSNL